MADLGSIDAEVREGTGKGSARAARRAGRIPAVIYGGKETPRTITLETKAIIRHYQTGKFLSTLFNIEVAGDSQRVVPRDVQLDPVTDIPLHVDFLRLPEGAKINLMVPVVFIDEEESPGLKRGGVLNVVRREIELMCLADAIPSQLVISLVGLEINDIIHISSVELPEGVQLTITDRDFTVATIASPTVVRDEEAAAAAEAEEGEEIEGVEGEEGEEGEEGAEGAEAKEDSGKDD